MGLRRTIDLVLTKEIADGALSADTEGRAKMADGFLQDAKVAADAAIAHTKLGTGIVKSTIIAGGAAGAHTVTGIATGDNLVAVLALKGNVPADTSATTEVAEINAGGHLAVGAGGAIDLAISDLTSEFSISGADTIDNTGGTDTTDYALVVIYEDRT